MFWILNTLLHVPFRIVLSVVVVKASSLKLVINRFAILYMTSCWLNLVWQDWTYLPRRQWIWRMTKKVLSQIVGAILNLLRLSLSLLLGQLTNERGCLQFFSHKVVTLIMISLMTLTMMRSSVRIVGCGMRSHPIHVLNVINQSNLLHLYLDDSFS